MRDIPIIFSAPMVLALLAGRKKMTRRLAWTPWTDGELERYHSVASPDIHLDQRGKRSLWQNVEPGDRLWVRENWRTVGDAPLSETTDTDDFDYRATASETQIAIHKWKPSIHMPRWASRLTLVVTATKVEKLQDISEDDARAEGVTKPTIPHWPTRPFASAFRGLWRDLHSPESWDANPAVVALSFEVHQKNIDAMKDAA